ncbi:GNAT family N-acetyltransferase [Arthrobacter monumenti]
MDVTSRFGPSARVKLRRAVDSDAGAIGALIRFSKSEAMPWLYVPHTAREDSWWVANVLLPGSSVWTAVVDNELLGVLALRPGWVDQLYVLPSGQRTGIGRLLLQQAKDLNPEGLQLWTFQRNTNARGFYEHAGFTIRKMTDGAGNEEREPDVLYAWLPGAASSETAAGAHAATSLVDRPRS